MKYNLQTHQGISHCDVILSNYLMIGSDHVMLNKKSFLEVCHIYFRSFQHKKLFL